MGCNRLEIVSASRKGQFRGMDQPRMRVHGPKKLNLLHRNTKRPIYLDRDQARGARVEFRPMVGEAREVLLFDDVMVARGGRVETVEDDSDEQVHEHVCDGEREAGTD